MIQLLLGLTLRWLVFPKSIGRLPMSTRLFPSLTPWNFIPMGTILIMPPLPPSAVASAQRPGALVAYPVGPETDRAAPNPLEFPRLVAVISPFRALAKLKVIALSFPRLMVTPSALLPHRSLKLGAR